jgi:hypothetical protein
MPGACIEESNRQILRLPRQAATTGHPRAMGIVFARSLVVGRDGAASAVGPFAGYAS